GRRKTTVPLVTEARDWQTGVFMGATVGSEQTAAAEGKVGVVRRDPMAMLPFMGYHVGDYFQHWLEIGKHADNAQLPQIFYVNWFRRGDDRRFLWPGFSENSRVLKWIIERIEGKASAQETPVGFVPRAEDLDLDGLDEPLADIQAALDVNPDEWRQEIPLIEEWFDKIGRDKIPSALLDELESMKQRLG
ncbi:phosphoenolpyruvate carboxykinase domain-containing protein, partial [Saccharomonospora azurea]|uniref:phosphoenolpyruvate carboxykinase domain-containing protein n=1 Tax=Saccharomonospora azurea TaxID=40988 RepID=UPI0024090660